MAILYGSQEEIEVQWKNALTKGIFHSFHFVAILSFMALNGMWYAMDYVQLRRSLPDAAFWMLQLLPVFLLAHFILAYLMWKQYVVYRSQTRDNSADTTRLVYRSYIRYRQYVAVLGISFALLGALWLWTTFRFFPH